MIRATRNPQSKSKLSKIDKRTESGHPPIRFWKLLWMANVPDSYSFVDLHSLSSSTAFNVSKNLL